MLCTAFTLTHHHHPVQLENLQKDIRMLGQSLCGLPSKFDFNWSAAVCFQNKICFCTVTRPYSQLSNFYIWKFTIWIWQHGLHFTSYHI